MQDGGIGRSWTHSSSWFNKSTAICGKIPSEKRHENWMNRASTTKVKRTVLKHRRGRGMVLPKDTHTHTHTHPSCDILHQRGSQRYQSFPWGTRGLSCASQTLDPAQERWTPKQLALKTNGNYVQENYRTRGSGKLSLNASVVKLIQPQNQHKNTRLQSTWTTGPSGVDPFINLEASTREAKPIWMLARYRDTGRSHFCSFRLPC